MFWLINELDVLIPGHGLRQLKHLPEQALVIVELDLTLNYSTVQALHIRDTLTVFCRRISSGNHANFF